MTSLSLIILYSASLEALAKYRPVTVEAFSQIEGVSESSVAQYSTRFIEAIRTYCATNCKLYHSFSSYSNDLINLTTD
jgi:superfamily II DNA helicase RecQ